MSDRFKFRGKCWDTGKWIIGYLHLSDACETSFGIIHTEGCFRKTTDTKAETVGQCTGLKDKNGTLIFEGDIVDLNGDELAVMFWYNRFLMVHEPSCGAEREGECKTDEFQSSYSQNDVEIIGNIHDE